LLRRTATTLLIFLGASWAAGVAAGLTYVARYQNAPGPVARVAERWPTEAPPINGAGVTLAVFLHPECPCSRATVNSLDEIVAHAPGDRLRIYVFAEMPKEMSSAWADSTLIRAARVIPHVHIMNDPDYKFARAFGAFTSGHTALYDAQGQRLFSGGITASRGHEGDNDGSRAIRGILMNHTPEIRETPVFGCALFNPRSNSTW